MPSHTVALVALSVALVGCAARSGHGPEATLARYIAAVEADRPDLAYGLLEERLRQRVTLAEFTTRWRSLRPELLAQARDLRQGGSRSLRVEGRLDYGGGLRPGVVFVDGRWRISGGVSSMVQASTPAEALRSLITALEQRNFSAVMALLSRSLRESLDRELEDRLKKLKMSSGVEIEVSANRARLQYDARFKIDLIREGGQWKILDFN